VTPALKLIAIAVSCQKGPASDTHKKVKMGTTSTAYYITFKMLAHF